MINPVDIQKLKAMPRPEVEKTPRPKTPWRFEKSFLARFPPFQEDTWLQCFEFDWNCSKLEKWLAGSTPHQRDNVYEYLKANYRQM